MTKLKGILLTQGMHGMISQVEGLAKALDLDFTHHTVELSNFWKLLPPKLTPISQKVFKKINTEDFDVIISCGRKSIIPSIYLKKNSNKKKKKDNITFEEMSLQHGTSRIIVLCNVRTCNIEFQFFYIGFPEGPQP